MLSRDSLAMLECGTVRVVSLGFMQRHAPSCRGLCDNHRQSLWRIEFWHYTEEREKENSWYARFDKIRMGGKEGKEKAVHEIHSVT